MSWCRWITTKAYGTAAYTYSWADYLLISRLKPIAKAIYHSQPVAHVCQGFSQVFRLPEIIGVSEQTKQIIKKSVVSNAEYLLGAVATERLVHKVYPQYDSLYSESIGMALDVLLLIGFTGRLFIRRAVDNNCYLLSLPKAVSHDMAVYISKQYSTLLANALWKEFKNIFFNNSELVYGPHEEVHYRRLVSELQKAFENFIFQSETTANSFDVLRKSLNKICYDTIIQAGSVESKEVINKFSKKIASIIVNEFFNGLLVFVPRFVREIKGDFVKTLSMEKRSLLNDREFLILLSDRLLDKDDKLSHSLPNAFFEKKPGALLRSSDQEILDKDEASFIDKVNERRVKDQQSLSEIMKAIFDVTAATTSANRLMENLLFLNAASRGFLQAWMPLNNAGSCGCNKKKKIHASLSTSLYYSGNLLWLTVARKLLTFLPESYSAYKSAAWVILFLLQAITYGQSVNEYKIVGDGQCTRHRYQIFSRNKAHSLGVGFSYGLSVEILSRLVRFLFQVDNFFTRDAIANTVLQLVTLATLANNKPLPGKSHHSWDIFFIQRKLTRKAVEGIDEWFIRDLNNLESQKRCINRLKLILSSKQMSIAIKYFLDGNDFFPNKKLINEINIFLKEKLASKPHYQVADPIDYKRRISAMSYSDPIAIIFKLASVQLFLKFYQKNINSALPMLDSIHAWSKTLAGPLLSLPLPNAVASIFRVPLLLLKDEALYDLIRKIETQMIIFETISRQTSIHPSKAQPLVTVCGGNPQVRSSSMKQINLEDEIKNAISTELEIVPKVTERQVTELPLAVPQVAAAPSEDPVITIYFESPAKEEDIKPSDRNTLQDRQTQQMQLEKHIQTVLSTEIQDLPRASVVPLEKRVERGPAGALLPVGPDYQEGDLNRIEGFEFMDLTPQTMRRKHKKHHKTAMLLFGTFAAAAKQTTKKVVQYARLPRLDDKSDGFELKRF